MSLLEVKNLSLSFGGLTAVNDLSFCVEPGEIVSIIGPNGAGKTSVFNAITGVYAPSAGRIFFAGRETVRAFTVLLLLHFLLVAFFSGVLAVLAFNMQSLWAFVISEHYVYLEPFSWSQAGLRVSQFLRTLPFLEGGAVFLFGLVLGFSAAVSLWTSSRRRPEVVSGFGLARTFQNIRLFSQLTVGENVLLGIDFRVGFCASLLRLPAFYREQERARRRVRECLSFVGLEAEINQLASHLPYGHQRRLEIARALAREPKLLLLDEPAAGMNPSEIAKLVELIREIRARGVSVLLIEHQMRLVMEISDKIIVLDYGNLIAQGKPEEVKANQRVITAYLGAESEMER